MAFHSKNVKFSLKDVGSEIIDQLSTDVYTGPASIMRELVKNAYDAGIALTSDDYEDDDVERQIVISRERDSKKVGRLFVADNGCGQDLDDLKANVQISISHKQEELQHATGFRGLGSWAILGAGSRIIISTSKRGVATEFRLTLDVKRIYKKLGSTTTLDDILNDAKCVSFSEQSRDLDDHFTVVEIVCDGPPVLVNQHELNRLYPYTNPDDKTLRELLIRSCPLPVVDEGGAYDAVDKVHQRVGYVPTPVLLDGGRLERRLPSGLSAPVTQDLYVGNKLVAVAWYVEDPESSRELTNRIDEEKHLLGGPGFQIAKLNVPIGPKNMFGDNVRSTILNWFIGEVQLVAPDVLPDAGGEGLRAGTASSTVSGYRR